MKTKEFNLSEKIKLHPNNDSMRILFQEDVKEFIRLLKEKKQNIQFKWNLKGMKGYHNGTQEMISIDDLDALAGEKLK
jgi:hypothetical protein